MLESVQYLDRNISEPSLRRLARYHNLLRELMVEGTATVSSSGIARILNLDPTQVRKDIEATGIAGKPKVGYPVPALSRWIEDFLGWNNTKLAVLAGAGGLGGALLGHQRIRQLGIDIAAIFDIDPEKVGQVIQGKSVYTPEMLPEVARRMHISLGVICTPKGAAQHTANLMVEGGIRGIWNFAPIHLRVPDTVVVHDEDLSHSLATLSFKVERRMLAERKAAAKLWAEIEENQSPAAETGETLDAYIW